jgi:Ca2+-dependent lipid-binding protein
MVRLKFAMPEGGQLSSDIVTVAVWDSDFGSKDDVVGVARLSMSELRQVLNHPFEIGS